jgi:hypothetical protein
MLGKKSLIVVKLRINKEKVIKGKTVVYSDSNICLKQKTVMW